ncbi:hypothetical protein D3C78_1532960 [compost metagenome]
MLLHPLPMVHLSLTKVVVAILLSAYASYVTALVKTSATFTPPRWLIATKSEKL